MSLYLYPSFRPFSFFITQFLRLWWPSPFHHKIISLLLHNCNFGMARNCNINIWYVVYLIYDPCERVLWPTMGSQHTGCKLLLHSLPFVSVSVTPFHNLTLRFDLFLEFVAKHTFTYLFLLLLSEGSIFLAFPFTSAILSLPWSSLPVMFARVLFYF